MKKYIGIVLLLVIALALFFWWQNTNDPNVLYNDPLSDEMKTTIQNKVVLKYDTSVQWRGTGSNEPYYGTINDCIVVQTSLPDVMWPAVLYNVKLEIAGYTFRGSYPDFNLCVYCDGEVCLLDEAYENGWLTKEQIGKIYEKHQIIYKEYLTAYEESLKTKEEAQD